jgi:hypothetical protein
MGGKNGQGRLEIIRVIHNTTSEYIKMNSEIGLSRLNYSCPADPCEIALNIVFMYRARTTR